MSNILKIGFRLFVITAISAILLGVTNLATAGSIRQQRINAANEARHAALPEAEEFSGIEIIGELSKNETAVIKEIDVGVVGNEPVGYTFKVVSGGFGGGIEIIVGINKEGIINNIQIGEHQETPGLGAKIREEAYTDQYRGKMAESTIEVSKMSPNDHEIQAITGATITSEAVTNGVNLATSYYEGILGDRGER